MIAGSTGNFAFLKGFSERGLGLNVMDTNHTLNFTIPVRANSYIKSVLLGLEPNTTVVNKPGIYIGNKKIWGYNNTLELFTKKDVLLQNFSGQYNTNISLLYPFKLYNSFIKFSIRSNTSGNLSMVLGNKTIYQIDMSKMQFFPTDYKYVYPANLLPIEVKIGNFNANTKKDILVLNAYGVYAILDVMSNNTKYTNFCNLIDENPLAIEIAGTYKCFVLLPHKLIEATYNPTTDTWIKNTLLTFNNLARKLYRFNQELYILFSHKLVRVLLPTFNITTISTLPEVITDVFPIYINNDNKTDFVISTTNGIFTVESNGTSYATKKVINYSADKIYASKNLIPGNLSIVFHHNESWYFWHNGRIDFMAIGKYANIVDNNGLDGLIISNNTTLRIFTNKNNTIFENVQNISFSNKINNIVLGDVNNNHNTDVVVGFGREFEILLYKNINMSLTIPLKNAINGALLNNSFEQYLDSWGNKICKLPFRINYSSLNNIDIQNLTVYYKHTIVINTTKYINEYIHNHSSSSWYYVPVTIYALNNIDKNDLYYFYKIDYFYAPPYPYTVPSLKTYEDNTTSQSKLIDLLNYFWDDKPKSLQFSVYGGNSNISGFIEDGHYFSVHTAHNWYGNATFRIEAVDGDGLSAMSNPFNVTVIHVDQPPDIAKLEPIKIRANTTYWLNLSSEVWDIDSPEIFLNTSDPQNITPFTNLSLRMNYLTPGNYSPIIYVSDGNLTNQTTLNISVYPYSSPMFLPIPNVVTDKNIPITLKNAKVNLRDYVQDPVTSPSLLNFTILNQSNSHINVTIEKGYVLVNPDENYAGISRVWVKVDNGKYSDTASFKVIVMEKNYPPVYLGGLKSTTVKEDTTWKVDLAKHFDDDSGPYSLIYTSNYKEIKIVGTVAYWTPHYGSHSLINVTFTATDNAGQKANSTPINLYYKEVNTPPVYIGGLKDIVMYDNETVKLNLSNYFMDEEHPGLLKFTTNSEVVHIQGDIAVISRPHWGHYIINFTAIDGDNSSLKAHSPNINLTVLHHNKKPVAYIDSVKIEGNTVILKGHGVDEDGKVVGYEWYSSIDGYLGNTSQIKVTLSYGKHIIGFRVMDNDGAWSNYTNVSVDIKETSMAISPLVYQIGLGAVLLVSGVNVIKRIKFRRLKKDIIGGEAN